MSTRTAYLNLVLAGLGAASGVAAIGDSPAIGFGIVIVSILLGALSFALLRALAAIVSALLDD